MRWLWYTLIGTCLVVALVTWASLSPGKIGDTYDAWVQMAILTAVVFGYLPRWGWHYRKKSRFWRLYFAALLTHCAILVPIFSHGRWSIMLLAVVACLEAMVLAIFMSWAMSEGS